MTWVKNRIDFEKVKADADTGTPTKFNTCFHTEDEAPDKQKTSNAPYSYERWLPIVLKSRKLSPDVVQKITLTHSQARLLLQACDASIQIQRVNLTLAEDLDDEVAPAFSTLRFPSEGLFVRLDACSPKDGAHKVPGKKSLHSVDEIILRLVTSGRCRSAINDCLSSANPVELYFLPFNNRMASELEYRVFCRPGDLRITGISQYRWHKPWRFADLPEDGQNHAIRTVCLGAAAARTQILADLDINGQTDKLIVEQGMSFDLFYNEQARCVELVELNPFGIRSPCGSCLFQWIRDREVLYDELEKAVIEFRVTW